MRGEYFWTIRVLKLRPVAALQIRPASVVQKPSGRITRIRASHDHGNIFGGLGGFRLDQEVVMGNANIGRYPRLSTKTGELQLRVDTEICKSDVSASC